VAATLGNTGIGEPFPPEYGTEISDLFGEPTGNNATLYGSFGQVRG
jgi:hypothetical protein